MTQKPPWAKVADQLRLPAFMDGAEADALAHLTFPAQHRAKLHSPNPIECVNGEVKRPHDVRGNDRPDLMPSIAVKRRQLHRRQGTHGRGFCRWSACAETGDGGGHRYSVGPYPGEAESPPSLPLLAIPRCSSLQYQKCSLLNPCMTKNPPCSLDRAISLQDIEII
jgi:hypothetical protein